MKWKEKHALRFYSTEALAAFHHIRIFRSRRAFFGGMCHWQQYIWKSNFNGIHVNGISISISWIRSKKKQKEIYYTCRTLQICITLSSTSNVFLWFSPHRPISTLHFAIQSNELPCHIAAVNWAWRKSSWWNLKTRINSIQWNINQLNVILVTAAVAITAVMTKRANWTHCEKHENLLHMYLSVFTNRRHVSICCDFIAYFCHIKRILFVSAARFFIRQKPKSTNKEKPHRQIRKHHKIHLITSELIVSAAECCSSVFSVCSLFGRRNDTLNSEIPSGWRDMRTVLKIFIQCENDTKTKIWRAMMAANFFHSQHFRATTWKLHRTLM